MARVLLDIANPIIRFRVETELLHTTDSTLCEYLAQNSGGVLSLIDYWFSVHEWQHNPAERKNNFAIRIYRLPRMNTQFLLPEYKSL